MVATFFSDPFARPQKEVYMIYLPNAHLSLIMTWAAYHLLVSPGDITREKYLEQGRLGGYAFALKMEFEEMGL